MTEKSFVTELTNDTRKLLDVYELGGSVLVQLAPGQSFEVESRNPETLYARWSAVRWHDGKVSFLTRTNWHEPERGRWCLKMLNETGAELERRQVGDQNICLPRGVPMLVACPILDPLVMFQSLTIRRVEIKTKDEEWTGYLRPQYILRDIKVARSLSELKALGKITDELGREKS